MKEEERISRLCKEEVESIIHVMQRCRHTREMTKKCDEQMGEEKNVIARLKKNNVGKRVGKRKRGEWK